MSRSDFGAKKQGDDPRASGVIEFIANWLMENGSIATPVEAQDKIATIWGKIKSDH